MKCKLILLVFFCVSIKSAIAQAPDWGTLTALDQAQLIVLGKMKIEDSLEGFGTLHIRSVIKGKTTLKEIKVQFSNRHISDKRTKQEEAPKYYYSEGQEGIFILNHKFENGRYSLMQHNLYYESKWKSWVQEKLILLKKRPWSDQANGLSGSVIIDSCGANDFYRFFYLCLRNDSDSTIIINTHYRIKELESRRITALVETPDNDTINLLGGSNSNCRLAGEPGWTIPSTHDFRVLKPGETYYLLASGVMRCFMKDMPVGCYWFQSTYSNSYTSKEIKGKIWTGSLSFPIADFYFDREADK